MEKEGWFQFEMVLISVKFFTNGESRLEGGIIPTSQKAERKTGSFSAYS